MTPRSLTKNIPTKSQKWKAPVKEWVEDLYFAKFGELIGQKKKDSIDDLPF